jgi:hypothetical protein
VQGIKVRALQSRPNEFGMDSNTNTDVGRERKKCCEGKICKSNDAAIRISILLIV